MAEQLNNYVSGTIAVPGCDSGDTTITLDDASAFPVVPNYRVTIEREIVLVTGISGNDLTVVRGQEGTTASAHSATQVAAVVLTAGGLAQYISEH